MSRIALPKELNNLYFQRVQLKTAWLTNESVSVWLPRNETIDDILRAIMEAAQQHKEDAPLFSLPGSGKDLENLEDVPENFALWVTSADKGEKLSRLQGILADQRFVSRSGVLDVLLVRAFPLLSIAADKSRTEMRKGIWNVVPHDTSPKTVKFKKIDASDKEQPLAELRFMPAQEGNCFSLEVLKNGGGLQFGIFRNTTAITLSQRKPEKLYLGDKLIIQSTEFNVRYD